MKVTEAPVVVTQIFEQPVDMVWNAITEQKQMILWFFDNIPDFKAEVGFKTQFNVQAPSRDFMHLWEVTEVITHKKIVVNWKYEGLPGSSYVTMELHKENNHTVLTVTTKVVEDFDDAIPEFQRESCVGGWTYFIKERLANYIN